MTDGRPITLGDGATLDGPRRSSSTDVDRLERMFDRLSPDHACTAGSSRRSTSRRRAMLLLAHRTSTTTAARRSWRSTATRSSPSPATTGGPAAHEAEIAVTVEDAWQHRGVGKRLARRLAQRARSTTASSAFIATMLPDNREAHRPPAPALARRDGALRRRQLRGRRRRCHARADALSAALDVAPVRPAGGRARRYTNRKPDHVSSTAHTLLSTRPCARPTSRTTFSREVGRDVRRSSSATRSTVRPRARPRARASRSDVRARRAASRRTPRRPARRALACAGAHRRAADRARVRNPPVRARARREHPARIPSFFGKRCPRVPRHERAVNRGRRAVNQSESTRRGRVRAANATFDA